MPWEEIDAYQSLASTLTHQGVNSTKVASRLFTLLYCGDYEHLSWYLSRVEQDVKAWLDTQCCGTTLTEVDGWFIGLNYGH